MHVPIFCILCYWGEPFPAVGCINEDDKDFLACRFCTNFGDHLGYLYFLSCLLKKERVLRLNQSLRFSVQELRLLPRLRLNCILFCMISWRMGYCDICCLSLRVENSVASFSVVVFSTFSPFNAEPQHWWLLGPKICQAYVLYIQPHLKGL